MMLGNAAGNSTLNSNFIRLAPNALPASSSSSGTLMMPKYVNRIGAAMAK